MMKRLFCLMALLLVPALAHADMVSIAELREQAEEMGRWTQTYEAHGRNVQVDIPIIIPEVEAVPVLSVQTYRPLEYTSLATEGIDATPEDLGVLLRYDDRKLYTHLNPDETDQSTKVYVSKTDDKIEIRHHIPYGMLFKNGQELERSCTSYYPYELNANVAYAENNNLTIQEAKNCLECMIDYYYGTSEYSINYIEVCSRGRNKQGEVFDQSPKGTYIIHFWQDFRGIPLNMLAYKLYDRTDSKIDCESFSRIGEATNGYIEIMDSTSYSVMVMRLVENGMVMSDIPLAPIDHVIDGIEKYIEKGLIRNIYSLRLGYTCFLSKESTESFVLYPMWILECDFVQSSGEKIHKNEYSSDIRDGYAFKRLAINAQTGEVIDTKLVRDDQLYCPSILTW